MSQRKQKAFGLFSPNGRILTTRTTADEAADAARILVGTEWAHEGYHVDPVIVVRIRVPGRHTATREPAHV